MKWLLFLGVVMSLTLAVCAEVNDDPHLWLEEVTGDKALAWVKERNAESTAALTENDAFRTLRDRLLQILDSEARIPFVSKAGDYYYNFWRDAKHTRGVWRRTTLEAYRQDKPHWEMVLDLDALAAAEQENWVWKGSQCLKPSYERCLLSLSRGGADATVTREFDVTQKVFVADGFVLPEAKSRISWRDLDSVFVATDFGPGSLTRSGYPRIVKEWRRGTAVAEAVQVFAGQLDDVSVGAFRTKTPGYERDWISRSLTFWTYELFLRREGQLIKIEKPDDARAVSDRDLLYITLRTPWTVGGKTWPAGALLVADLERFLQGERQFDLLFEPGERKSLAGFTPARHHLLLNELDNVRNRLSVLTREEGKWRRAELPGVPQFSAVHATPVDPDTSDDYFMTVTDYLTPPSLYMGTLGAGPAEKLKAGPAFFDADGLAVSQHEAVSADGTRIPYFQVARHDLALNGRNPTLLYGYGGFEVAMLPGYQAVTGAAWLEAGGVYVVANIRGGGEFGPRWHQAALQQNRHKAYEDFIAVAEDLMRQQVTTPAHLGIMGQSNGGLLMGNMLTRWPTCSGRSSARSPCSTCSAILSCSRARAGRRNTAIQPCRRNGRSSARFRHIITSVRTCNIRGHCSRPRRATTASIPVMPAKWSRA